jgi:2'-5' RNA ligase
MQGPLEECVKQAAIAYNAIDAGRCARRRVGRLSMPEKTHTTALVLIPPQELWRPIQDIRRRHDRQFRRWMPHLTLLYPFRPPEQFDAAAAALADPCRRTEPFEVALAEFRSFSHGRRSFTVYLAPEPPDALRALHEALWQALPDCDDTRRHAGGFTPHLSVGQVRDRRGPEELTRQLQAAWRPIRFAASQVSLIWRGRPPDDVFRVGRTIALGRGG